MDKYCNYCGTILKNADGRKVRCNSCQLDRSAFMKNLNARRERKGLPHIKSSDPDFEGPYTNHYCVLCSRPIGASRNDILYCEECKANPPKKIRKRKVTKKYEEEEHSYTIAEIANMAKVKGISYGEFVKRYGV